MVMRVAVFPGEQPLEAVPKYGRCMHTGELKAIAWLTDGPMRL